MTTSMMMTIIKVTDEGSVPEIAQYDPYYLPLNVFTVSKGSNFYILFNNYYHGLCIPYLSFLFILFVISFYRHR